MIIIKVELLSAITGKTTELARMHIINDGTGDTHKRNYKGISFRGRNTESLNRGTAQKIAQVKNWPSQQFHVWNLVRAMLTNLGYMQGQDGTT